MGSQLRVHTFAMIDGERHSILVNHDTGLPVYAPNLFLISQIRNASLSHASVSSNAYCLAALYRFFEMRGIDIEARLRESIHLEEYELDSLRDHFKQRHQENEIAEAFASSGKRRKAAEQLRWVTNETQHKKLWVAAQYLSWLAHYLNPENEQATGKMKSAILARCPRIRNRNAGLEDKGLSDEQAEYVLEVVELENSRNPFSSRLRSRNRLIILLMYELGIRVGELLNIRVGDFDFSANTLRIIRRPDQNDDTRQRQPLVKTEARALPLADWLIAEVYTYVMSDRSKVKGADRCPYLFVTYKAGSTQGQGLSISAYNKIWKVLRDCSSILDGVTGHRLRHSWNFRYSKLVDEGVIECNQAVEESTRSYLMGWQQGSGTAKTYNRRHTIQKANAASVELQRQSYNRTWGRGREDGKSGGE